MHTSHDLIRNKTYHQLNNHQLNNSSNSHSQLNKDKTNTLQFCSHHPPNQKMHFTTISAAIVALAATSCSASVLPTKRSDALIAQFRVFSAAGCSDLNEGFFTVDQTQTNICTSLAPYETNTPFVSIELQGISTPPGSTAAEGCELFLYSDTACSQDVTAAPLNACQNAAVVQPGATVPTWNSYFFACTGSS
ncbi:hypothetical protein BX600DRAFT_471610 [Xylariales sp. PMI_506]|nr:hypothetical protein BX600DRAFT_471610 [Xylariales sp. PMI_506]